LAAWRFSEKFTSRRGVRDDRVVRTALVLLALASFACVACAGPSRSLPRGALLARVRQGNEPPAGARSQAVVAFAAAQIGRPYCWGGTGPGCFDCSGLVHEAWGAVGVRLPRTSTSMAEELAEVPLDELRAGDILWWPGHVGIYAGEGWAIEALDSRHGVVRRPASNPLRALRPAGVD
jgi:cell wall-associated NlpC family hydrolase